MELAALGRPFSLGMLYDCRRDALIPGLTLWDNEALEKDVSITPKPSTEFEVVASESIEDKTSALEIEGSLKASFLCELVKVSGSAKYLNDTKTSKLQARVTLKYKATTKFRQLSMNHLGRGNVKHPDVFESGTATHVVTGILYGAQAFFVFDRDVNDTNNQQVIEGDVKAVIKEIPTISIKGHGALKMDDADIAKVDKFSCKFHGDFSLDKNPASFKDAIQVYQSLPELLGPNGENAVPLKVWLMPLKDLDSSAAQIVRQISSGLVTEAQSVLEYFSEIVMKCNDELKRPVAQQFPQVSEKLRTFKEHCKQYKLEFQKNVANILPLIRGGEKEESVLIDFLEARHMTPFNDKHLTKWLDCKEREINSVSSRTEMMKNTKIVSSNELEIILNSESHHVVCFALTSLQTSEPYLSALSSYLKDKSKLVNSTTHVEEEQWYISEQPKVRNRAMLFMDFSEANKDNKDIQFLITATENEKQRGASIYLYQDGLLVNDNFQPPSKPQKLTSSDTTHNSVTLKMQPLPFGAEHVSHYSIEYRVTGQDKWHQHTASKTDEVTVSNLSPNTDYVFRYRAVCLFGRGPVSEVSDSMKTLPTSPPGKVQATPKSCELSVTWEKPTEVGEGVTVERYSVEYAKVSTDQLQWNKMASQTEMTTISGLEPMAEYAVRVTCECGAAGRSKKSNTVTVQTIPVTVQTTRDFLRDLGLEDHYREKLSLNTILQIDKKTFTDGPATCHSDLVWHFLKMLMMVNVTARNVKRSLSDSNSDASSDTFDLDTLLDSQSSDRVHPLDIVTAIFLCSDGLLQQEIALKMSMCQFSLPLLLPNCETGQCQFMLWAMRDIIKRFRSHSLQDPKSFIEDRMVLSKLPMVSFVRLGECSLSKSKILNDLLSNPQQYHDTFVHRNMEGGDCPRKICDGLVEMSWYLPSGNTNIDGFGEPLAIANLRGDIKSFEKQYEFLCQTSAAVFVFFDTLDPQYKLLRTQKDKAQLFLVVNTQSKGFSPDAIKEVAVKFNLSNNNFIMKTEKMNDADFVKHLRDKVSNVVNSTGIRMKMENMTAVAKQIGIVVDDDTPECQRAREKADAITSEITDIVKYKEEQLPLQGQILKKIVNLEKEGFRLKNAGEKNKENYKGELRKEKKELREQQKKHGKSLAMTRFISALSSAGIERAYFLKWMRINLDNLSRAKLSSFREQYKEKCKSSENKDEIKELDEQLSNSSLGLEHFFREMGQLYESAMLLSEASASREQMSGLPKLCAELLLEGFPMELMDGDASTIPLRWVKDVLTQLNVLVGQKNRILVTTVLGVQSTGKSTLLNTMFGVQFAVSSGRCTRGAFMLLVKVEENFKSDLNCDFVLILDTEGLKSPELAQLDDSYEHDNELATLVVGLSDVTIINIAMENIAEMKDILQIVVHAFLRMKEVGKMPDCQFVHQNVSDVSAKDKNQRDRRLLLQQLNEMTQAAAKMEKKEEYKNFTDVMKYNPETGNWYIPGLWHGNPPMAPVNAGYSEAVYEFKKNIIEILSRGSSKAIDILAFPELTKDLWTAVQQENFIFSFRNSLVAEAYMYLCKEFSELEWDFKKHMYAWVTQAETKISNFGIVEPDISKLEGLLTHLKIEALKELSKWETKILDHLTQYFEKKEGNVHLVERYREDFSNSAKNLRKEIEKSVDNQLEASVDIRRGMMSLEGMQKTFSKTLEVKVLKLIEECRKSDDKRKMISSSLDKQFDELWKQTESELNLTGLQNIDVYSKVEHKLWLDLSPKGSHASDLLAKRKLQQCGNEDFKYKPEGNCLEKLYETGKNIARKWLGFEDQIMAAQNLADRIIKDCTRYVSEKVENKTNYHDTYISEILHKIDNMLSANGDVKTHIRFEVLLKQHICGLSAKEFEEMHKAFRENNDPKVCLNKLKNEHCSAFKDLFHERDQCQKKAEQFTNLCLIPAVEHKVTRSLGPEIVDAMLVGKNAEPLSTRNFFQHSLLKYLLSKDSLESYICYITKYEDFVQEWISDKIVDQFSSGNELFELEQQQIKSNIKYITDAITNAQKETTTLENFFHNICKEIGDNLVIKEEALRTVLYLNESTMENSVQWLTVSVKEMEQTLTKIFKEKDLKVKLRSLDVKPEKELFNKLFGCGKQCPFCKVPCEAGGKEHTEHFASIHRPKGLGRYKWRESEKLTTDVCSYSVTSDDKFRCSETDGEFHPFKEYRDIFPSWKIQPDVSIEASDYWKYVMVKFNDKFAQEYEAKPADIPSAWTEIDKEQAEKSLDQSFNIK